MFGDWSLSNMNDLGPCCFAVTDKQLVTFSVYDVIYCNFHCALLFRHCKDANSLAFTGDNINYMRQGISAWRNDGRKTKIKTN